MSLLALVVLGCTPAGGPVRPHHEEPTTEDTAPPAVQPALDTATIASTGDTGVALDCSVLPAIPVPWATLEEFETGEDFDLDGAGYLCTTMVGTLTCRDRAGDQTIVTAGLASWTAGTRILPDGNWVYNDVTNGAVVHVDAATGARRIVASGIAYPNGLEVSRDGRWVFVGENASYNARQIEVATGQQYIVGSGMYSPNGVILSPDEQTLYVGSFGGGTVYAVDRIAETEWDAPRVFHYRGPQGGGFDGINVDACGNVYITEYTAGRVTRLTPDGLGDGIVAELPDAWIPNLRWGHDVGGWRSDVLYVAAYDRVFALDMGIPGKKHVLMP